MTSGNTNVKQGLIKSASDENDLICTIFIKFSRKRETSPEQHGSRDYTNKNNEPYIQINMM
jgi:hypothetical protein